MTDLAEALRTRLTDDAAVAAMVADRVHWVRRDQGGELPAIVLRSVSRVRPELLDGPEDMQSSRVQVDCYAETHEASWDLAEAAATALRDEAVVGDMQFWNATVNGPRDLGDQTDTDFIHLASVDVLCRHTAGS